MRKIFFLTIILIGINLQAIDIVSIQGNDVNIRSSPKRGNNVIKKAYKHNVFEKLDTSGKWVKVLLPNGDKGWVAERYTRNRTVDEVKVSCREADILAGTGAGAGGGAGWLGGLLVCCGVTSLETAGFGCVACAIAGGIGGFFGGLKAGESLGEYICDF